MGISRKRLRKKGSSKNTEKYKKQVEVFKCNFLNPLIILYRWMRTKTVSAKLNACHSMFLKEKCWENGSKFLHGREEYTSQTCPCCSALNKCNETYKCKYRMDNNV